METPHPLPLVGATHPSFFTLAVHPPLSRAALLPFALFSPRAPYPLPMPSLDISRSVTLRLLLGHSAALTLGRGYGFHQRLIASFRPACVPQQEEHHPPAWSPLRCLAVVWCCRAMHPGGGRLQRAADGDNMGLLICVEGRKSRHLPYGQYMGQANLTDRFPTASPHAPCSMPHLSSRVAPHISQGPNEPAKRGLSFACSAAQWKTAGKVR